MSRSFTEEFEMRIGSMDSVVVSSLFVACAVSPVFAALGDCPSVIYVPKQAASIDAAIA